MLGESSLPNPSFPGSWGFSWGLCTGEILSEKGLFSCSSFVTNSLIRLNCIQIWRHHALSGNGKWYDESGEEISQEEATARSGLHNTEPVDIDIEADRLLDQAELN